MNLVSIGKSDRVGRLIVSSVHCGHEWVEVKVNKTKPTTQCLDPAPGLERMALCLYAGGSLRWGGGGWYIFCLVPC